MTVGIDRNTTDPAAWGEALVSALTERPEQVMNAEALAGWFATAIEAGRRSAARHESPSP